MLYPKRSLFKCTILAVLLFVPAALGSVSERNDVEKLMPGSTLVAKGDAKAVWWWYAAQIDDHDLILNIDEKMDMLNRKLSKHNLLISLSTLFTFMMLAVLLVAVWFYRRNRRKRYMNLMRQSRQQAGQGLNANHTTNYLSGVLPLNDEEKLMKRIYQLVVDEKLFKDSHLTVAGLSERLNVNRTYISNAINRTTGNNFITFINEYRIKEAIRILSDNNARNLTIDQIADQSGFSNRQSFYEAFKKAMGISPSVFRKYNG